MSPITMQKVESASRAALDLNRALNARDIGSMTFLLTEDCVLEDHAPPPEGSIFRGRKDISSHWADMFTRHPGLTIDIEDLSGFGDRCILRWKRVTSEGSPPLRGIDIVQVRDGRIYSILSYVKG